VGAERDAVAGWRVGSLCVGICAPSRSSRRGVEESRRPCRADRESQLLLGNVGRKAKRVKLGRREARPRGESGHYWRWRVPRFGSERIVELAVWYPRQIENPYRQGPVRLRQHSHASQARASRSVFTSRITSAVAGLYAAATKITN